jgi:hypothetical protein
MGEPSRLRTGLHERDELDWSSAEGSWRCRITPHSRSTFSGIPWELSRVPWLPCGLDWCRAWSRMENSTKPANRLEIVDTPGEREDISAVCPPRSQLSPVRQIDERDFEILLAMFIQCLVSHKTMSRSKFGYSSKKIWSRLAGQNSWIRVKGGTK